MASATHNVTADVDPQRAANLGAEISTADFSSHDLESGIVHTSGQAVEGQESACADVASEDNVPSSFGFTEPRPTLLGSSRTVQQQKHSGIVASKSQHCTDKVTDDPQLAPQGVFRRRSALRFCFVGLGIVGMCLLISAIVIFFTVFNRIESFHVERGQKKPDSPLPPAPVEPDACPAVCQQAGLELDPGACTFGRECVYGHGWCREASHALPLLPQIGKCHSSCSGPIARTVPSQLCGSADIPSLDIMALIKDSLNITKVIKKHMPSTAVMNEKINQQISGRGLEDLSVEVDALLVDSMVMRFDKLDVTWLAGCWPPQRYAVVSGALQLPRGEVRINLAGVNMLLNFADFEFQFKDLRVSLECAADFAISGLGSGSGDEIIQPDSFAVSGGLDIDCGDGLPSWGPVCQLVRKSNHQIQERLSKMLPEFVASGIKDAPWPLSLGRQCPGLLRNTFVPLGYAQKSCCEAAWAVDASGSLIGGQFNGAPAGFGGNVSGVTCTKDIAGLWAANCDTVPGNYYQPAAGSCREADTPIAPWTCPFCASAWNHFVVPVIHHAVFAIHLLFWAVVTILATCGCGCVVLRHRLCHRCTRNFPKLGARNARDVALANSTEVMKRAQAAA